MSDRNFDEHKWNTGWLKDHGYKPFPTDRKGFHFHDHDDRGAGVRDIHNTFGETKFRHFDWIPYMRYWCYKVLPLAYDDSLSYYEVLCKCIGKLNEVIECMDNLPEIVYEMALHGYLLDNLMENICPLNDHSNEITTADRHEGELIWLDGDLYMVTRDFLAGERYVLPDTEGATANISRVTFEGFVRCLTDGMKKAVVFNNEEWNHTFSSDYVIGDWIWWEDHLYRIDKNVSKGTSLETAVANGIMHEISIKELLTELLTNLKKAIAVGDEGHNVTYSISYKAGDLIWWNNVLYELNKDVNADDTIDTDKMHEISIEELLNREKNARIAADDALGQRVDKEIQDRTDADNALGQRIDKEITNRTNADTALGQRIDKEITDRTNADTALGQRIDKEITDRTNADNTLQGNIDAEAKTRKDTDDDIYSKLNNHETRITTLEDCCEQAKTDISNLKSKDTDLQTQISGNDTDIAALQAAVQTAQNTASAAQTAASTAQSTADAAKTAASTVTGTAPNTNIYNITGTEIVGKVSSFSFASVKTNIDATSHRGLLFTVAEAYHMLGFSESGDPSRLGVYVYNGDYNAYASNLYAGLDASDASYYVYAETPVSGTAPVRADVLLTYYSGNGVYIDRT